ncbi:HAD family hydrolase [Brevibacterium litoralis]|uniref:HAD family hydrolase n=1 Tax=Brevibacterium litoralis TaxID=3138935 RepID=UPI0032ECE89C
MTTTTPTPGPALDAPADLSAPAPRALLLDFGGVVMTTTPREDWEREFADWVVTRARTIGYSLDAEAVAESLRTGRRAHRLWKDSCSRRPEPQELAPAELVGDFLFADLPAPVRAMLALDADPVLERMVVTEVDHAVRPGVHDLLTTARGAGILLGIVSNAESGRAHRRLLAEAGLGDFFGVQIYSDEVGIRKPHPGMITRAAHALGTTAPDTWYVGDTLDRDVVVGRRAGVGAVLITRDSRTDAPPFSVAEVPDLLVDDPRDLLVPLRAALASPAPEAPRPPHTTDARPGQGVSAAGNRAPAGRRGRPALLLDNGGVITDSESNPEKFRIVARHLVALAERAGVPLTHAQALAALENGWDRHRARKHAGDGVEAPDHTHAEVDPAELWGEIVGQDLPEALRPVLRAEASELSLVLHRAKSIPAPRNGVVELIEWAHDRGITIGIVSNTISGRGVRELLDRYGVAQKIGPAAYSDEIGIRKPGGAIFEAALAGVGADRADVVYVGDKVVNDGRGGRDARIGTVCLLRGGKDSDADLDAALAAGLADHVLDSPAQVIDVLAALDT